MTNGTMSGEDTSCGKAGRHCPTLYYKHHNGIRASVRKKNNHEPAYGTQVWRICTHDWHNNLLEF